MRIPETPEFDPIAFLVTLKFPKRNRGSEAWSWVLSDGSDGSAEAKAYEKELRLKSIEEINQLVALERERIAETRLEREEAEEKRRATAEANIFYNHPKNDADVEYWGKLPFWNLEEAVSLSFGKNPKTVNITTLKPHLQVSDFARKFSERLEHVQRAEITRQLSNFVSRTHLSTGHFAWESMSLGASKKLSSRSCPGKLTGKPGSRLSICFERKLKLRLRTSGHSLSPSDLHRNRTSRHASKPVSNV